MVPHDADERDRDALFERLGRRRHVFLGDDDDRRFAAGGRVVGQLADAARHQDSQIGFAAAGPELGRAHRVAKAAVDLVIGERNVERQHRRRRSQPAHMAIEQERFAVVGPQRLVDPFAVQKPMVEHGNHRVLAVDHAAVDIDHRAHATSVPRSAAVK